MRAREITRRSRKTLAWIAPLLAGLPIAFYVGGILLSMGAFAAIGPELLGAFGPTEIALSGWLRLGSVTLLLAPILVIAALLVWPLAALMSERLEATMPRGAGYIAVAAAIVLCGYVGFTSEGVFSALLAVLAAALFAALLVGLLIRDEAATREAIRPFRWYLTAVAGLLALAALGEAQSPLNPRAGGARSAILVTPQGPRCARLLLLGSERLLYAADGRVVVGDHEGKVAVDVGAAPADVRNRCAPPGSASAATALTTPHRW